MGRDRDICEPDDNEELATENTEVTETKGQVFYVFLCALCGKNS